MAFDCFLKIDGIEGESTDDKHSGWIEVATYTQQKRDGGGPAGNIAGGWERQRNCKV